MVTSVVLLAVETVPLLIYIFVGLVILAVPVAVIWDKVVQPKLDEKKKAAKEAEQAAAEPDMGPADGEFGVGEPAEGAAELAMPAEEGEGPEELAMPAEGEDEATGEPPEEAAPEQLADDAFEEALPDDAFTIDTDEKPKA